MSDRKSITINSASLLGGGGTGGGKRGTRRTKGSGSSTGSGTGTGTGTGTSRRLRPSSIVQPSTLKKTLLERIKQHQRLREQGRDADYAHDHSAKDTSSEHKDTTAADASSPFSQSMDFLRKLALKKRQNMTQRRPSSSSSHVHSLAAETAKTPEAKMLNQVADTLHNGEIITNTGLLGLPVINTDVSSIMRPPPLMAAQPTATAMATIPMMTGMSMPGMSMPGISDLPFGMIQAPQTQQTQASPVQATPNITELANLYNSTVASMSDNSNTNTDGDATTGVKSADDLPIHVPEDPESFLPSIFIKEAPPHGCLKNGSKPTFREWANKMLHKPVETMKNMFGGDGGGGDGGDDGAAASSSTGMDGGGGTSAGKTLTKQHEHPENIAGMRVKIRRTQKKKYRIGKHDDVVGVLLKNKEAQRHIQKQHLTLKQKTIGEIRKYLYEHHLLKIGSNAPPDVLRRMYEDSILTGEVKNTNKGVLLHNFLSGES